VNTVEYELDMPDGHHFYEAGMSPFEADSVLVLCRDVTARKKAEDQQKKLEAQIRHVQKLESLGVLAGGIAHDFNNLMMAVTGNIHLARQAAISGECPLHYLDAVDQAANRAADLSEQMLAYSGRGEFRVLPLYLNSMASEISDILSATVSKKARVIFKLDPDLPMILADNTQVRQVVMNLLTNASESLEQNAGTITISTGVLFCSDKYLGTLHRTEKLKVGNYAWIQVDDTGKGMDDALMDKIFDPFFTTKFTGRGLGLSAVLGIMSSHAGALAISSEPGLGSSFRALFPVADTGACPADEPDTTDEEWTASGTALFVDDEPLIRSVGEAMLSDIGFNVIIAIDGLDGLNLFKSNMDAISIVIMDLTMPNIDGDELFREIRKLRNDIPVIISSGYNESEIIARFTDVFPEGFLKKPYTARQLKEKIRALLGQ
jgi:two-component system cell cycle sensor histidine kinase/response regulator CckA